MKQIKTFERNSLYELEYDVNNFLKRINAISISHAVSKHGTTDYYMKMLL